MVINEEISTLEKIKNRCWSPVSLIGGGIMSVMMLIIMSIINFLCFDIILDLKYIDFILFNMVLRLIISYFVVNLFVRPTSLKLASSLFNLDEYGDKNMSTWSKLKKKLWSPVSLLMCLIINTIKLIVEYIICTIWIHHLLNPAFTEYFIITWILKIIITYFLIIFIISPVSLKIASSVFHINKN